MPQLLRRGVRQVPCGGDHAASVIRLPLSSSAATGSSRGEVWVGDGRGFIVCEVRQ